MGQKQRSSNLHSAFSVSVTSTPLLFFSAKRMLQVMIMQEDEPHAYVEDELPEGKNRHVLPSSILLFSIEATRQVVRLWCAQPEKYRML